MAHVCGSAMEDAKQRLATLLHNRHRQIRALWIHLHSSLRRGNHQIEVFHRHGAEQHFVAKDQGADKAGSVGEGDFHRADVGAGVPATVRRGGFTLLQDWQLQLRGDVLGDAKEQGSGIDERIGHVRLQPIVERVAEFDGGANEAHAGVKVRGEAVESLLLSYHLNFVLPSRYLLKMLLPWSAT